jgi:putative drug exporter of the RND superfamily
MLRRITMLAIAAPRRLIAISLLIFAAAAAFGIPVVNDLSAGGFRDPSSESTRASQLLAEKFGQSDQQIVLILTAPGGVRGDQIHRVAADITEHLQRSPFVYNVVSAWTPPEQPTGAGLISNDGQSGLIVANLKGGENQAQKYARILADQVAQDRDGVTVRAGGIAMAYAQINGQSERDLLTMESLAIPLTFLALTWVFGGIVAAALPVAVGLTAIVGSMAILRLLTFSSDVSIFALNLSTAMGFALAIDYTLLIISRYREELAESRSPDEALIRTMVTAGRTVVFSATTVALAMAVMVLFPMYFLTSFAYAGVATVAFAVVAAIIVTPAAIVVLGPKVDALSIQGLFRGVLRRSDRAPRSLAQQFWFRLTVKVMQHALPAGLAVVALLTLLGIPFLSVQWGFGDDRLLPPSASAHQVGDDLRNRFPNDLAAADVVVLPNARDLTQSELDQYAADLSAIPGVSAVSAPTGTFVKTKNIGPPSAPTGLADNSAFFTVASAPPSSSRDADMLLDRIHRLPGPAGRSIEITGLAQINRDSVTAITSRLPLVLGLIAGVSLVLLFLLTGSVVLPLMALFLNVLSLTATFGALVWIFQDGHIGAFGTTPTGTLIANTPVLLFCIAFGLSMDYEVFLVSRIREYWVASARTSRANDESVAQAVARTGRVITAAALVMSISFAALTVSQVSFMRMSGLGLTLAVLMDATLVRMVLVPASMHVLGRFNWWAPKPLAWLHDRMGMEESASLQDNTPLPAMPYPTDEFSHSRTQRLSDH